MWLMPCSEELLKCPLSFLICHAFDGTTGIWIRRLFSGPLSELWSPEASRFFPNPATHSLIPQIQWALLVHSCSQDTCCLMGNSWPPTSPGARPMPYRCSQSLLRWALCPPNHQATFTVSAALPFASVLPRCSHPGIVYYSAALSFPTSPRKTLFCVATTLLLFWQPAPSLVVILLSSCQAHAASSACYSFLLKVTWELWLVTETKIFM